MAGEVFTERGNRRGQRMKNLSENQINRRFLEIADTLAENVASIRYGLVSVELQVHEGRIVATTHSKTEKTRLTKEGEK